MPKRKQPKQEEPKGQPSLQDMATRELLKSIRDDLAEQTKRTELAPPPHPPKQPRNR